MIDKIIITIVENGKEIKRVYTKKELNFSSFDNRKLKGIINYVQNYFVHFPYKINKPSDINQIECDFKNVKSA